MNTVASSDPRILRARITNDEIIADLADGRIISVPLAWSWRLSEASPAQRANFRLIGTGQGVHWPDMDEDISVEGLLHGSPAPRPKITMQRAGPVGERSAAGRIAVPADESHVSNRREAPRPRTLRAPHNRPSKSLEPA
jgi:hypothetical protein